MTAKRLAHTKVTRQDWIDGALAALDHQPIDQLRVLNLAATMKVSRSSFYWYFKDQDELRRELLLIWERNTESIVDRTQRDAKTLAASCLGVFECWADHRLYHATLDLSVRDWGRRDNKIATRVSNADRTRLEALTEMFSRHGFGDSDALVRARLLYHSQVGYYAVDTQESMSQRLTLLPHYLTAMIGSPATAAEFKQFKKVLSALQSG